MNTFVREEKHKETGCSMRPKMRLLPMSETLQKGIQKQETCENWSQKDITLADPSPTISACKPRGEGPLAGKDHTLRLRPIVMTLRLPETKFVNKITLNRSVHTVTVWPV